MKRNPESEYFIDMRIVDKNVHPKKRNMNGTFSFFPSKLNYQ